jgi:hypothetical protein
VRERSPRKVDRMAESTSEAQAACIRAQAQRVRELLAPRADLDLESAALAARATLGDRAAIREIQWKPARVKTADLSHAAATVYRCSCRAIIRGPEARCKACGAENTRNAAGRGATIR